MTAEKQEGPLLTTVTLRACVLSKGGHSSQLSTTREGKHTCPNFPEKLKIQNVYVKFLLFTKVLC